MVIKRIGTLAQSFLEFVDFWIKIQIHSLKNTTVQESEDSILIRNFIWKAKALIHQIILKKKNEVGDHLISRLTRKLQ